MICETAGFVGSLLVNRWLNQLYNKLAPLNMNSRQPEKCSDLNIYDLSTTGISDHPVLRYTQHSPVAQPCLAEEFSDAVLLSLTGPQPHFVTGQ